MQASSFVVLATHGSLPAGLSLLASEIQSLISNSKPKSIQMSNWFFMFRSGLFPLVTGLPL